MDTKKNIHAIEIHVNNILYLERKCARITVRGYCLFLDSNSFSRAKLEVKFQYRGTDNFQGRIYEHIFAQIEAIVFVILLIFCQTRKKMRTNSLLFAA